MRPVLTAAEYRRVDKAHTGDLTEAMDRAGHAVALAATRLGAGYGTRVAILAGPGNNGGDGYVAGRYLKSRGVAVEMHALGEPSTPEARRAADLARSSGIVIRPLGSATQADVVIDAMFGGGVRGGLPSEVLAWMETSAPVVAVDFPTGLDPDTGHVAERAFFARETVTFSTLKTGHVLGVGPDHCGSVAVVDIGINGGEPSLFVAEEADAPRPARSRRAHKWSAGAVLVVGGSEGITGAAVFAGLAAASFGAGSVVVASSRPEAVQQIAPSLPSFDFEQAVSRLDRFDVVVAGPGLDERDAVAARPILVGADRVVLDAGGLTADSLDAARKGDAQVIVTPHDAEFARVAGVGAGTYAVRALANRLGVTTLRKGNPTMISDGSLPVLVTTGGPELAAMGTGDVLAGMIGALWARGSSPREAAISAAYWHGSAGRSLAAEKTVTAERLIDRIASYAW